MVVSFLCELYLFFSFVQHADPVFMYTVNANATCEGRGELSSRN